MNAIPEEELLPLEHSFGKAVSIYIDRILYVVLGLVYGLTFCFVILFFYLSYYLFFEGISPTFQLILEIINIYAPCIQFPIIIGVGALTINFSYNYLKRLTLSKTIRIPLAIGLGTVAGGGLYLISFEVIAQFIAVLFLIFLGLVVIIQLIKQWLKIP